MKNRSILLAVIAILLVHFAHTHSGIHHLNFSSEDAPPHHQGIVEGATQSSSNGTTHQDMFSKAPRLNAEYYPRDLRVFPKAPKPSYAQLLSGPGHLARISPHDLTSGDLYDESWPRELGKLTSRAAKLQLLLAEQAVKDGPSNSDHDDSDASEKKGVEEHLMASLETLSTRAGGSASSQCINDTGRLLIAMIRGQGWALKFLDATGKPVPGISQIRATFVGDYDLCRSLVAPPDDKGHGFKGNYCDIKALLGPPTNNPLAMLMLQWGVCMPSTCNDTENTRFFAEFVELTGVNSSLVRVAQAESHTDERNARPATYFAILALSLLGLAMLAGTIYDIAWIQWPLWRIEWAESKQLLSTNNGTIFIGGHRSPTDLETTVDVATITDDDPLLGRGSGHLIPPQAPIGVLRKSLLAFSVYTNGSKLLNTSQAPGSITCIHGIRFLSMTWVILGHLFVFGIYQTENFVTEFPILLNRWTFDVISNAFVAVDTFFLLSGLLTAYVAMGQLKKGGWKINWGLFYFHRFWRLTPPYMLVLMMVVGLQQYCGKGALWPSISPVDRQNCESYWWTNFLYINNFKHDGPDSCFAHSWYLANDMQFFLVSPIMLIALYLHKGIGLAVCGTFILASWVTTGALSVQREWPPSIVDIFSPGWDTFFTDYYIKPWCRISPFVIGILTGYLLAESPGNRVHIPKPVALIGWPVATATALAVLYGLHADLSGDHAMSVPVSAIYNTFARSAWALCVAWVIVACRSGWGGMVNTLLSWPPFIVLGRLSYVAYLVHPSMLYIFFESQQTLFYLDEINIAILYMGMIVAAYSVSFVLVLALEAPMIGLEKVLLPTRRRKD